MKATQALPARRPGLSWNAAIGNSTGTSLDDYMRYYKTRYREERHLARHDPATIENLSFAA